ncbi:MAG TPA: NADP-dependent oxidoreductase [Thermoanaerobaculia bacterium]|nr:NADP-dependent oxidoreductase [Thermoanaerobaculia bacterium]
MPRPGESEVLIALVSAGVGGWDADMRGGWSPFGKPEYPLVLGTDGAGTIAEVGSRVRRFEPGDRAYAFSFDNAKGGFYAEYVAVASDNAALAPEGLDLAHAGAIPATGLTALQGVDDALEIRKGETILIHGASGGVGTLALQFAKWRGARVLAAGSGARGVALAKRLGADAAVDGKRGDVAAAARMFAPRGLDAILAFAGGRALTASLDCLRRGGRVAYPNGIDPAPRKRGGVKITSYDLRPGPREFERLSRAVEGSRLEVPIDHEYTLANASAAHKRLARGGVLGKVVLRIA